MGSGDYRTFGFVSLGNDADIVEETWVVTATFAYGAGATGSYSIVPDSRYTAIGSGTGSGIPFQAIAGTVTFDERPQLTVQSTPITGVEITGGRPGTTNYSVACDRGEVVNLNAPATATDNSILYDFVQWTLDGDPQTLGETSVSVTMDSSLLLVAEYLMRTVRLSVRSVPAGVTIRGDKPGTTPYDAACGLGSTVSLEAPVITVVESASYRFVRWILDGIDQPDGEATVAILMNAGRTAEAVYTTAPTLILRGPADRGDDPPFSGGGTFVVDVLVNTMPGLGGFQAGLDFLDELGTNAGFLVSNVGGDPNFCGMKVEFNSAVWPDVLALCTGDSETFGFMSNVGDLNIASETWVFRVTYEYPSDAIGTYTIATDPDLTAVGGSSGVIPFAEVAGTVTIAERRTLTVQSTPLGGVAISGDKPGTTEYQATCFSGQTVSLAAPLVAVSPEAVDHEFVRWIVDGVAQPDGQAAIDVEMAADRTAVAEYVVSTYPLHVQSQPFTGMSITGDAPGTTDYTVAWPHRQAVSLTAPATVEVEGDLWNILHWVVNGEQKPNREASVSFSIDGETTAVAVYSPAPRLIFSGPQDRGELPPPAGGGEFMVEVSLDSFYGFGGMQVAGSFIDASSADAAFLVSMVGGNPDFGGMKVEFNSAVWPNIMPLYAADQRTVGFMSLDPDSDITQETWVFRITYAYGSEAIGHYAIKAEPDLTVLGGGGGAVAFREVAGNVDIVPRYTLTVQSIPLSGVAITGSHPGTTEYSVVCLDQDAVGLQAPAEAANGAVDYDFVRWMVNGAGQPDGELDLAFAIGADTAAVAVYTIRTHELAVGSDPIVAVEIAGTRPGTTVYTATCDDEETVTLSAPAVANDGAVRYDFIRWVLDGVEQDAGAADLDILMSAAHGATAMYAIRTHTLTVQSIPPGVEITGTHPGTTEYTVTCNDQESVSLTAPDSIEQAVRYRFVRWHINGAPQTEGQLDVAVTMDASRTLVAEYVILTHTLTVQSMLVTTPGGWLPVTGVPITGDKPGSTTYTATCEDGQAVHLVAPRLFQMAGSTSGTADYAFHRWMVDGVECSWEFLNVQVEMRAAHTVVAKYGLAFDVNADCRVNVLDLLQMRGKLNHSVYTGDNWKCDVNFDKKINVLDLLAARNKLNKACVK